MTSTKEWPSDGGPHSSDTIGQALAGLVVRDSAGNPIPGMIAPPTITAVGGAWKVEVSRFVYVRDVAGSARFSPLSAAEQHDIASAVGIPAGQSRIDLIVWDAVAGALSVVAGTPGTSPAAPGSALVKVAEVRVASGDAQVVAGQIRPVFAVAEIVGAADTGWIAAGVGTAKYRRIGSVVRFSGGATPTANNQTLFTLPKGFRPAETFAFGAYRQQMVPMRIEASGAVVYGGPGGDGAISLASAPSFIAVP